MLRESYAKNSAPESVTFAAKASSSFTLDADLAPSVSCRLVSPESPTIATWTSRVLASTIGRSVVPTIHGLPDLCSSRTGSTPAETRARRCSGMSRSGRSMTATRNAFQWRGRGLYSGGRKMRECNLRPPDRRSNVDHEECRRIEDVSVRCSTEALRQGLERPDSAHLGCGICSHVSPPSEIERAQSTWPHDAPKSAHPPVVTSRYSRNTYKPSVYHSNLQSRHHKLTRFGLRSNDDPAAHASHAVALP